MGYYIRVLGKQDINIHIDELIDSLKADGLIANFSIAEGGQARNWTLIEVANQDGEVLTQIERNPVVDGELGQKELDEFKEEIKNYKPVSAVKWLEKFFDKVKVIYAFQLLNASMEDKNFPIVTAIKIKIWSKTKGILQADNEGFTNEEGYHILWQFSDNVTGEWCMARRNLFGNWENFKMELGDLKQREEFFKGKMPKGATKL